MKVPEQYNSLMPYLIIYRATEFINFMKEVFGATEQAMVPRDEGLIMHGELRLGDSVIMVADATDLFPAKPAGIFVYVESVDEVYKKALAAGSTSTMAPSLQSYGYSCGFRDSFGNDWWPCEA